ncbi:MAG: hypothetical protein U0K92_08100 [Treponema sp.]|nr:hypothetical protein [Treponema sp.]
MKKVTKLVYGLSACLLLTLVGCNNETEDVTPKAVAEKVAIKSVEVPDDVKLAIANNEVTVVTATDKEALETELKESLTSEELSNIFNQQDTSKITESSRSITHEDLNALLEEFSAEMEKYNTTLTEKGSASMTFSKTPGKVTGISNEVDLSIPIIFFDMKTVTSASQTKPTITQSSVIAVGANVGADLSKVEGLENFLFKNVKAGAAVNSSYVVNTIIDYSNINSDILYTGYINAECNYSLGGVFVTKNKVAGKLLATADIKLNVNDISKLLPLGEYTEKPTELVNTISEYVTIQFDIKAYDFEGNEVCSLISTDDFAKVTDFIDLEVLLENIPTQEEI